MMVHSALFLLLLLVHSIQAVSDAAAAPAAAVPAVAGRLLLSSSSLSSSADGQESRSRRGREVPGPASGTYRQDGSLVADSPVAAATAAAADIAPVARQQLSGVDRLKSSSCLMLPKGSSIVCKTSLNGRYRMCLKSDATVVLLEGKSTSPYWSSPKPGKAPPRPYRFCVQDDGNLVAYDAKNRAFYATNTCCQGKPAPVTVIIQNDGNLVAYDDQCVAYWSSNTLRADPIPPPCSTSGGGGGAGGGGNSGQRATLQQAVTAGPFGGGDPSSPGAFDDASLAAGGSNAISRIAVRAGSWIDALQVAYGSGGSSGWHGGSGGDSRPDLTLASGEFVTLAYVRSGAFVDELRFVTNKGRFWSSTGESVSSANAGDGAALATPCPLGAYKLVYFKGVGNDFLERVELVWALLPGAQGPLLSSVAAWTCQPGLPYALRQAPSSDSQQPQCLSTDGKSCMEAADCYSARLCVESTGITTSTCASSDGLNDPLHWCTRARGALALPAIPKTAIRVLFLNVAICNNGSAVSDPSLIRSSIFTDPFSLQRYWPAASFGRAAFDESTSAVADLRLPCGQFSADSCDVNTWADWLRDNAAAVLGAGRSLSDYQFQMFIAPDNLQSCQDVGIGFASGNLVWIRSDFVSDLNIYKHELGHSLGLSHSSLQQPDGSIEEYGDGSTPMGFCPKCLYAAPHQLQLGWSRVAQDVDWSAVAPGTSRSLALPTLSDTLSSVIVIRLELPAEGPGRRSGRQLFLSFRVRKLQDAALPDRFHQATSVHTVDGNSWLLAWLADGQAYVSAANKLVVQQVSRLGPGLALVKLCKFAASDSECGPFDRFQP